MRGQVQRFIGCLLIFIASSASAVEYIQPVPIGELLKSSPVKSVKAGTLDLPIISWGADIATIAANGNSIATSPASAFGKAGLDFKLVREDIFTNQLEKYLSGQTPYLRGTMGMVNMASDLLAKDPKTKPVVIAKLSDSAGGDALVVKDSIDTVADLKGKTIVLQAYGPHLDYLTRILKDAGLSLSDVKVKWVKDLTGTDNSPAEALRQKDVDAVFVITPDALALTSNGNVGTGAEDSVRGAKILMSTKTANTVIVDVYAVRADYLEQNRKKVEAFVIALLKSQEEVHQLVSDKSSRAKEYGDLMKSSAKILLDSEAAVADAQGMYTDARLALFNGNKSFFAGGANVARRFEVIANESLVGVKQFALASGAARLTSINWDYDALQNNVGKVKAETGPAFNADAANAVVSKLQQQGRLEDGELYSFEVYFAPNQNSFSADLYQDAFNRVIELATTYGGALITVEGHSDPMQYLKSKKGNASALVLGQIKQSAKNLSYSRAQSVRDVLLQYASSRSIILDPSQFVVAGHGIAMPKTGVCGDELCVPKNEAEWKSNMRVVFRIIQVEAEASVFNPL